MAQGDWQLWACGEFCGVGPDGNVRESDASPRHWRVDAGGTVELTAPRNGWVSLRTVVVGRGEFTVSAEVDGCEVDLFREFYHRLAEGEGRHGDALVPLAAGDAMTIPAPDLELPDQQAQAVWVDIFVPVEAAAGSHAGHVTVDAGGQTLKVAVQLDVLDAAYPDADCIQMDYNSYGSTFMEKMYADLLPAGGPERDQAVVDMIHKYHALVYEHHGLYHQLGFGHSGATNRFFAPKLSGDGRERHVSDWALYDAHYGPLLDGSAFAGGRRKAAPIWGIYTPINPDWPADWLGFGQPGYRVEWVNVLREFDKHFQDNGWTHSVVEYFFNHKKRYRYYDWDGDEPRYERDDYRFKQYRELLDEAVSGSPVPWRFRIDASWMMKEHFETLAGVTDFWVCGGFVGAWEEEVHVGPMARGDIVWWYNGTPTIDQPSADICQLVMKTWGRDFDGNCIWLTTSPGPDPWLASNGAATGLVYPGVKFGVDGPIASVRMKVLRNAVQDANLLQACVETGRDKAALVDDLMADVPMELWWKSRPAAMDDLPPMEWGASNLKRPSEPDQQRWPALDPLWWQNVRDHAHTLAKEVLRG